jgi:hypothetical protein
MHIGGDWRDVTAHARQSARTTISRGRGSPSTNTPPSTCAFELNNNDLRYSPRNPTGPYYGLLGRNTPVEVSETLAVDTFSRTVANDWGTADTGQRWVTFGAGGSILVSDWQVPAFTGTGTMSVPVVAGYRLCLLSTPICLDADVMADIALTVSNITGGDVEPGNIYLRSNDTASVYYMCRVVITSAEAVTVTFHNHGGQLAAPVTIAGLTHTASQTLRVRAQIEGNTLRAKVWAATAGEPYDWAITVHDTSITTPGRVGIRNGIASSNTNTLPLVFASSNVIVSSMRYAGEIGALPSDSDVSNKVKTVSVEAAGILRRLGQGDVPLQSVMRRAVLGLGAPLVAYWPMEDAEGTLPGPSSALPGGSPMIGTTLDYQADDTAFPCSDKLPTLSSGFVYGNTPNYVSSGANQVRWLMQVPATGMTHGALVMRAFTYGGTTGYWAVTYQTGGGLSLIIFDTNGTQIFAQGYGFSVNGKARRYSLELTQNGANIDWALSEVQASGASGVSGTLAGRTFGRIADVLLVPDSGTVLGHVSIENQVTSTFALGAQLDAYNNETAIERLTRLCAENAVPFAYVGSSAVSTRMGPQRVNTLLTLLRECESADAGSLGESRGAVGLSYRTRSSSYALTPTVTIDAGLAQLRHPFQPVEDDRSTANDVTVERTGGGAYRRTLDSGRMSTQAPPTGVGRYATTYKANVSTALDGGYLADWLLTLGTIDEARYPNLGLLFDATPTLEPAGRDIDVGHLVRVVNAGTMVGIYDPIDQLVLGYRETLSDYEHTLSVNAEPASAYAVTVLDSATTVLDSGTSTLTTGYSATATSLSVTTTAPGDLFATSGIFPLVIIVAGETMTVSAISGATSPQTFTVSRSTNGVVKTQTAGAPVHVFNPTRLGL